MPNHFSSIGFQLPRYQDFRQLAVETAEKGQTIFRDDGHVVRWNVGHGTQLWAQIAPHHRIIRFDPHFVGRARIPVRLTERVQQPQDHPLEGCFYGWADPVTDKRDKGAYPLVFHAPDFGFYRTLELPALRDVQIAAFAHELSAFASDADYFASQGDAEVKYAAESFLPIGTFPPKNESEPRFVPYARFAGHVLGVSVVINPLTELSFHWIRTRTYGGEYDVVVDPEISAGLPIVGGVISGSFWLSGQIIGPSEDRLVEITP